MRNPAISSHGGEPDLWSGGAKGVDEIMLGWKAGSPSRFSRYQENHAQNT